MAETYQLRNITSSDVFLLVKILKKAGVKNFVNVLQTALSQEEKSESIVGLQFVDVIVDRLPECEAEIYEFLSKLSGITIEELATLDADIFIGMIYDVFQNPKFKDFIRVALRFAK